MGIWYWFLDTTLMKTNHNILLPIGWINKNNIYTLNLEYIKNNTPTQHCIHLRCAHGRNVYPIWTKLNTSTHLDLTYFDCSQTTFHIFCAAGELTIYLEVHAITRCSVTPRTVSIVRALHSVKDGQFVSLDAKLALQTGSDQCWPVLNLQENLI